MLCRRGLRPGRRQGRGHQLRRPDLKELFSWLMGPPSNCTGTNVSGDARDSELRFTSHDSSCFTSQNSVHGLGGLATCKQPSLTMRGSHPAIQEMAEAKQRDAAKANRSRS